MRCMTKVAAIELGKDGIRANSIHPGGIMAPMIPEAPPFGGSGGHVPDGATGGASADPKKSARWRSG